MPTSTGVLVELPFPSEHLEMTHQRRAKLTAFKHKNLQNVASALVHGAAPAGGSVFTFQLAYTVCKSRVYSFFHYLCLEVTERAWDEQPRGQVSSRGSGHY